MYIAIDLGGTFIKLAYISTDGIIHQFVKTETSGDFAGFLETITSFSSNYEGVVRGIAISSPGTVYPDGKVGGSSAIPFIHDGNLKEKVERTLGLPVSIENDANCAALAEVWKGAAQEYNDAACIILGTGIGGAIIKDRQLHKGRHLLGGEIGYTLMSINPETKSLSQCSLVASTGAMIRSYAKKRKVPIDHLSGEWVFKQAEDGDHIARDVIETFYFTLATMVYNIHYIYNPDVILIGGAISERPDLLDGVRKALATIFVELNDLEHILPEVNVCHFRNHANLLGALYAHLQISGK
ncbi:ROK family protein [Halalkalibacter sp. APA_J-10(15)]|uniref:ROK family protein n=1 Tax=Halalkalibacter sp. APA_J-10(15) TaxID=2933805 RepID=UPI001FF474F9|nr:ROK family protein [Halalkalibacter sp. APA_J-10(15)]MCK0470158.1 ROK family protein [Halalkalibacter sp. APA_J-10(15)]